MRDALATMHSLRSSGRLRHCPGPIAARWGAGWCRCAVLQTKVTFAAMTQPDRHQDRVLDNPVGDSRHRRLWPAQLTATAREARPGVAVVSLAPAGRRGGHRRHGPRDNHGSHVPELNGVGCRSRPRSVCQPRSTSCRRRRTRSPCAARNHRCRPCKCAGGGGGLPA